jgi:hypothetical protein
MAKSQITGASFGGWPGADGDPPDDFWRTLVANRGKTKRIRRSITHGLAKSLLQKKATWVVQSTQPP